MAQGLIKKVRGGEYYLAAEGCFIRELWNAPEDDGVSVAWARVTPGVTTAWHRVRETWERYLILSGTGVAEVGDLMPTPVAAGDVVVIPPGVRQRITNNGKEDLVFLAVCTPRFTPERYAGGEAGP